MLFHPFCGRVADEPLGQDERIDRQVALPATTVPST